MLALLYLLFNDEHVQVLILFGTLFTGLFGLLTLVCGALCYFLRHMITHTIPRMVDCFHAELIAERRVCHEDHQQILQTILAKHEAVIHELRRK